MPTPNISNADGVCVVQVADRVDDVALRAREFDRAAIDLCNALAESMGDAPIYDDIDVLHGRDGFVITEAFTSILNPDGTRTRLPPESTKAFQMY